jgi:hypothetical protein
MSGFEQGHDTVGKVATFTVCEWFLLESAKDRLRVLYPGYCVSPVMTHNSGYDRFPPVVNGWETTHPILDTAPPLMAEGEGPPT